jgi:YD repeat-containing protein
MDQTPTTIDYLFGVTDVTNPMGGKQSHGYSNFNGAPRLTSFTDEAGNTIQMVYEDAGRRTGIVDRLGGISGFEFDPDSGLTTRKLEADGALTQYAYRAIPKKGMTFYRTRQITMADGTAHTYEYDASGNLTKWTDNGGATWSYAYDGMGMTTSVTHPSGGTNRYTYNADGTFATFTDSAANTMRFDQDASRRLNKITYADGSTYSLAYDPRDLLMNVTNEIGQTVSYEYDRNGNTMSITDPTSGKTSWEYDAYDRPVKETDAAGGESSVSFDAMGRPISFTGRDGRTGMLAYDVCSRLESVKDAEGRTWSLTLDAEDMLTGMTDPAGESFSYQADAMGRLTEVTEPGNETHTFDYDALGRLTGVAGPGGEAYGCVYNARGFATRVDMPGDRMVMYKRNVYGQTTEMTDPEGNTWKRAYDALYRCTQITQPDGTTYRYTFDDRNRVAAIQYPEESGTLMIQYDGVGNVTNLLYQDGVIIDAKTGELKQAVQQSEFDYMKDENGRFVETGSLSLAWNNAGQLVESNGIGNRYDKTNNLVEVTYAPGKTVTYAYEKNRLAKVTDWLGGETVLMYDNKGVMTGLTRPNGKKTAYETSRRGRIEKVTDEVAGTISVQYNDQGRIAGFVHTGTSLPSQSSIWKVRQFGFNSMNHVTGYTYDDQGRLQQDNRRSYSWNAAKRLSSFSASQGGLTETHQLVYDGKGNLLRVLNDLGLEKRNSLYTINYAYPAARIAVESDFGETDSDPITPLWYYVYTPSGALLYRVNAATNKRFFYHYSHTGDVIAMSDDAGNADIQYAYDPYGVIAERSQNILSENKGNPFKYRGALAWFHEPGIRGGLYFTSDGWYDATPMRWLSQGKVAFVGPRDMNPFLARARNEKSWNRFWGGVQTVAGLAEMTVGGAGVIVPEPGSTAGGVVLFAVGFDSYQAGVRQLMSGEATSTLLAYGVAAGAEKLGANPRTAKLIGIGADVTVALLAGNPMSAARSASTAPARGARVLMDPFKGAFSHGSFKKIPDQLSAQLYCKHWDIILDLERAGSKGVVAQRGEWSAQLMAEITAATGKEIGLFRVGGRSGQRVAVLGTKATVPLPTGRGMVYRLIGHTHPSNVLMFSVGDLKVLRDLRWNRLQWLINNGKLSASSSLSKAGLRDSSLLISPYVRPTGRVLRRTVEEGDRIRIEQFLDVVEKARGQVP